MMRAYPIALLTLLLAGAAWAQDAETAEAPAETPAEAGTEAPAEAPAAEEGSDPAAETPAEAPAPAPAAAEGHDPAPQTSPAASRPQTPSSEAGEAPAEDPAEHIRPRRIGDDDIHLTMRWGMRIQLDPAFDALGDDRNHFAAEIGLDVRVWGPLAVGFSFTGSSELGELYGLETRWQDNSIFLSAVYRHRFDRLGLSAYGRLGPTVHWYHLSIGDDLWTRERFEDDPWQFGARAAAGLEFWPISPRFIPYMGRFGVGVVLEGYYDQAFQTEWSSGGVDPGEFDPTGPGWSLGVTGRF